MYKTDKKKLLVSQKPSVSVISVRKVVLKQKEVKKVEVPKKIKKIEKKVKKIVKKSKRKVNKKIVKRIKKEPEILEKKVVKVFEKPIPKAIPTITKKVVPIIKKETIVTTATKDMIKNDYLLKLRKKIERNKIYPKRAKRLKQEGKVVVSFEIAKNGKIKSVSLKDGCSYRRLNNAAIKLLEKIAMFDPIPNELGKNKWAIEIPINYSIVNS
jgi:protein TonB